MTGNRTNPIRDLLAKLNREIFSLKSLEADLLIQLAESPEDVDTDEKLKATRAQRIAAEQNRDGFEAASDEAKRRDFEDFKAQARRDAVAAYDKAVEISGKRLELAREIDRTTAKLGELTKRYQTLCGESWNHGFSILKSLREVQRDTHWDSMVTCMRNGLDNAMPNSLENAIALAGIHKITGPISPAAQCDPAYTVEAATRRSHDDFELRLGDALAKMPDPKRPSHD